MSGLHGNAAEGNANALVKIIKTWDLAIFYRLILWHLVKQSPSCFRNPYGHTLDLTLFSRVRREIFFVDLMLSSCLFQGLSC